LLTAKFLGLAGKNCSLLTAWQGNSRETEFGPSGADPLPLSFSRR
jgi:hypothetical protein